jgi:hypothetical protein
LISAVVVQFEDFRSPRAVLLWRSSILPFAVRRTSNLLPLAGLPTDIARQPDTLRSASLATVQEMDRAIVGASVNPVEARQQLDASTRRLMTDILQSWIGKLTTFYPKGEVIDLIAWLQRNEVEWGRREQHWAWWRWLQAAEAKSLALPFGGGVADLVLSVARAAVASYRSPNYQMLESRSADIELNEEEESLLRQWHDHDDPNAVFDAVGAMSLARTREIAYRSMGLVRAATASTEWEQIIDAMKGTMNDP